MRRAIDYLHQQETTKGHAMYTTANEAKTMIETVIESGDATADEFDIDAIFDENFEYSEELQQFVQITNTDEFWASVERHAHEA